MGKKTIISAEEALKNTTEYLNSMTEVFLKEINDEIAAASTNGKRSIFPDNINSEVSKILQKLGYTVTKDTEFGSRYKISW